MKIQAFFKEENYDVMLQSKSRVDSGTMCRRRGLGGRLALIAFGKQAERVDLSYEVGDAGPPAEPEPDYEDPHHYEAVQYVHRRPAWEEERRLLRRILPESDHFTINKLNNIMIFFFFFF